MMKRCTIQDDNSLVLLKNSQKSKQEIAQLLNRTEIAIEKRLCVKHIKTKMGITQQIKSNLWDIRDHLDEIKEIEQETAILQQSLGIPNIIDVIDETLNKACMDK
jgi:hypothetical protein